MTEHEFARLIDQPESETLDYKQSWYDFRNSRHKFIKDVLAMANTPRQGMARIVFGVAWSASEGSVVKGLDRQIDDAELQSQFPREKIQPSPRFAYHPFRYRGRQVGILEVPIGSDGPYAPLMDLEPVGRVFKLKRGAFYYRNGSQNAQAIGLDLTRIHRWFFEQRSSAGGEALPRPDTPPASPPGDSATQPDVLPITLAPASPAAFKRSLLTTRRAEIRIDYTDGRVEKRVWNATRLTSRSNILGNLRSREEFRAGIWQQNGIAEVHVAVVTR